MSKLKKNGGGGIQQGAYEVYLLRERRIEEHLHRSCGGGVEEVPLRLSAPRVG